LDAITPIDSRIDARLSAERWPERSAADVWSTACGTASTSASARKPECACVFALSAVHSVSPSAPPSTADGRSPSRVIARSTHGNPIDSIHVKHGMSCANGKTQRKQSTRAETERCAAYDAAKRKE
jgi:hypothetical protein